MKSAQLNILIETGADFVLPFTVYDDNDQPIDLTGAKVEAQLREYSESPDCYEFICSHNGTGGRITLTMPNEVSSLISYTYGVYDVKVVLADGTTSYPLNGNAEIRDGVTKPIDGTMLYMIGIATFDDLPTEGIVNRLYFCYDDRRIYRWNGTNYVATATGNGIQSIELIGTAEDGVYDTYRIFYDDGTHYDFVVINGGIHSIEYTGQSGSYVGGLIDHYRINYIRGHQMDHRDFEVHQGYITYAGIYIDLETGDMKMVTQDEYAGPTFRLDEESGDLYMVLGDEEEESDVEPEEEPTEEEEE